MKTSYKKTEEPDESPEWRPTTSDTPVSTGFNPNSPPYAENVTVNNLDSPPYAEPNIQSEVSILDVPEDVKNETKEESSEVDANKDTQNAGPEPEPAPGLEPESKTGESESGTNQVKKITL